PDIKMGGVPVTTEAVDQINGGMDSFVASITPNGNVAWIQGIGGDGNEYEYARDVTTDSWNNIIVTGHFSSDKVSFDGQVVHRVGDSENSYVAKINPAGQTMWVRGTEIPNSQDGTGVDTDSEGNIFITGTYTFDAKFGSFILPAMGNGDMYIVKLTPDGTPVKSTYISGTGQEVATGLRVNDQDKIMVSAYYYSTHIEIGEFSSSKLPTNESDAFIAILSNDLATVECAEFITGSGAITIEHFKADAFGNATLFFNFWVGYGLSVTFNSQIFTDPDYFSVMAIMRNNQAPDEAEISDPFLLQSALGKDTTLCIGEKLSLSVPVYCNAEYKWNTGSADASVEVSTAGLYWVDVTLNGITVRGDISVSYYEPINVSLGNDRSVCFGETVSWVLPVYKNAVYQWSDGASSNEKCSD
ncbi:MAG TPA: hypothetical protein VD884_06285, partial [Ohtaekwangia sp.]|nr:hypothetical protein [Ohtaekwangia sp.]